MNLRVHIGLSFVCATYLCEALWETKFNVYRKFRAFPSPQTDLQLSSFSACTQVYCSWLCLLDDSCNAANYFASSRNCHLVTVTGLSLIEDSSSLAFVKAKSNGDGITPEYKRVAGEKIILSNGSNSINVLNNVRSEYHCQLLCESTMTSCGFFNFNYRQQQCWIYAADFYDTWTSSESDVDWNGYYKYRASGRKLLYKVSKGIGIDIYRRLVDAGSNSTANISHVAKDNQCQCYVKSDVAEKWSKFNATEVDIVIATNGVTAHYLNLSATGQSLSSFFMPSNIITSSWADLQAGSAVAVMDMSTNDNDRRYFKLFSKPYIGCNQDAGWMTLFGSSSSPPCSYDFTPIPQFTYCSSNTSCNFSTSGVAADAFLLYVAL